MTSIIYGCTRRKRYKQSAPDVRFDAQISVKTILLNRVLFEKAGETPDFLRNQAFHWQGQKDSNSRHAVLEKWQVWFARLFLLQFIKIYLKYEPVKKSAE